MRTVRTAVLVVTIVCAWSYSARAQPACTNFADCEQRCRSDGAAACTRLAKLLAEGSEGRQPDRARAAELLVKTCRLDDDPIASVSAKLGGVVTVTTFSEPDGHAEGCLALAELVESGWAYELKPAVPRILDRAIRLGARRCTDKETTGCHASVAAAVRRHGLLVVKRDGEVSPEMKERVAETLVLAERGCSKGDGNTCEVLSDLLSALDKNPQLLAADTATRLEKVVEQGRRAACLAGDGRACFEVLDEDDPDPAVRAALEKSCKQRRDANACIALAALAYEEAEDKNDTRKLKAAFASVVAICKRDGPEICNFVAEVAFTGEDGVTVDKQGALEIGDTRCAAGDRVACEQVATNYEKVGDPEKARERLVRACTLSPLDRECTICRKSPDADICKSRALDREAATCFSGRSDVCYQIGQKLATGSGVKRDVPNAAVYYRRACDGGKRGACIALHGLCSKQQLGEKVCRQDLIHSPLFYEAEHQFRVGASANLAPAAPQPNAQPTQQVAVAATTAGLQLQRGSLDADLVVSVVLDRARRAAIRVVVDTLKDIAPDAKRGYMKDLLMQGAALLADPSTLRREKLQDLAMVVVRAFIAANIVDSLYPTSKHLGDAPLIGAVLKREKTIALDDNALPAAVRAYLVDVVYDLLGRQPLFARAGQPQKLPACPFGAAACKLIATDDALEQLVRLERIFDALRLGKALHGGGLIEARRFIEETIKSRRIASFDDTPGLVLGQWRSELINDVRGRLTALDSLKTLIVEDTYAKPIVLADLRRWIVDGRKFVESPQAATVLGEQLAAGARAVVAKIARELALTTRSDADTIAAVKLALAAWSDRGAVLTVIKTLESDVSTLHEHVGKLAAAVDSLESTMRELAGGEAIWDIEKIPLHAIGDIQDDLAEAAKALKAMRRPFRRLFPNTDQLDLARSASARLLGFFSVIDRLARVASLDQTCGEIVAALELLGAQRHGKFIAPLFDVIEPVLARLATHEPMSIDLLFGIIARARLDSLVSSLQTSATACKDAKSSECWTTKVVHALQESVERDGSIIRVDGAKFAKRLASHGDEFQHRHLWRFPYFHLTVGLGSLTSDPYATTMSGLDTRTVPVVSEQVGLGVASPVFGEYFTFKAGLAASGILYRAVLDSQESNAVMVHMPFVAIDVAELVELYVSHTLLLYPPEDENAADARWGFSAGISVPLSAYLERQ